MHVVHVLMSLAVLLFKSHSIAKCAHPDCWEISRWRTKFWNPPGCIPSFQSNLNLYLNCLGIAFWTHSQWPPPAIKSILTDLPPPFGIPESANFVAHSLLCYHHLSLLFVKLLYLIGLVRLWKIDLSPVWKCSFLFVQCCCHLPRKINF